MNDRFKWTKPDGNIVTYDNLTSHIYENYIEFDFNLPNHLKGKGIGKTMFNDTVDYFDNNLVLVEFVQ